LGAVLDGVALTEDDNIGVAIGVPVMNTGVKKLVFARLD